MCCSIYVCLWEILIPLQISFLPSLLLSYCMLSWIVYLFWFIILFLWHSKPISSCIFSISVLTITVFLQETKGEIKYVSNMILAESAGIGICSWVLIFWEGEEVSKMIATVLSNPRLKLSFKMCVCLFDVFLHVLVDMQLPFAPDMLPLLSSQTWPLMQIMYIHLVGLVQSYKILTYEIKLFSKCFYCDSVLVLVFFLSFSHFQHKPLIMAILLVFISKFYSSQFPAAESK